MIDATFVAAIQGGMQTEVCLIDNKAYATKEVYNPPLPEEPLAARLKIGSLTGLVDYCKELTIDGLKADELFIQVASYETVRLCSKMFGVQLQRQIYIEATTSDFEPFKFGHWYSHTGFCIALQALFVNYGDRAAVLRAVGTVKESIVKTSNDDGISQSIVSAAGIALISEVSLPNPVNLRPFRTFLEIEQPASNFILRAQSGKPGEMPTFALFESDGGQWRREARLAIRDYLRDAIASAGIAVLA